MTRPTVLVTGGAGFIGSHACKALAREGFVPVSYDNLSNGSRHAVKWGPLVEGDLENEALLLEVMTQHRPVCVLHFAALIDAAGSVRQPDRYHRNNVLGTRILLGAMRKAAVDRIVFSSTAAIYGNPSIVPIPESYPLAPVTPYGAGKQEIEALLRDLSVSENLGFCSLRYFNAAGADPEGELHEDHDPETHLIPLILQAAFGMRRDITVYGTDYDTPDGTCIRDYVHVSDLAEAHVLAVRALLFGKRDIVANLGTGVGHSVHEIIKAVESTVGRSVVRRFADRRPGDPAVLLAAVGLAERELGWVPRFRDISDMVQHAARHLKDPVESRGRP
jgi:UDP-glucose-4-epimerase GalE